MNVKFLRGMRQMVSHGTRRSGGHSLPWKVRPSRFCIASIASRLKHNIAGSRTHLDHAHNTAPCSRFSTHTIARFLTHFAIMVFGNWQWCVSIYLVNNYTWIGVSTESILWRDIFAIVSTVGIHMMLGHRFVPDSCFFPTGCNINFGNMWITYIYDIWEKWTVIIFC